MHASCSPFAIFFAVTLGKFLNLLKNEVKKKVWELDALDLNYDSPTYYLCDLGQFTYFL